MKVDINKILVLSYIYLVIFLPSNVHAQSHGLQFSSYDVVQEKRTSLDLGAGEPFCVPEKFNLSFDIQFTPNKPSYFGYIVRLINKHNQNIDLVYDERSAGFNIIVGEKLTGIKWSVGAAVLLQQWRHMAVEINGNTLALYVDGKLMQKGAVDSKDNCYKIIFGTCNLHDFRTTDVPAMQLSNIRIAEGDELKYYWPLNESEGTTCRDSVSGKKATVVNPVWGQPLHARWQLVQSRRINGIASVAFDKAKEQLYIVGKDSIQLYSVKTKTMNGQAIAPDHHHLLLGSQSVFHPLEQKLYHFYIDKQQMTALMPGENKWSNPFDTAQVTEYWQANKFFSRSQNALYILGGYGQLKYKNKIQRYNYNTNTWEIPTIKGDAFTPRYLSAAAATTSGDTAYVLGGYGSITGDQILNPKYLYDLLLFDVKQQSFKRLYTLPEPKESFVFGSSMVLDEQGKQYYALTFPNDRFDSHLQLIKGSLTDPSYAWVGDTIPYDFQDTKAIAELFYCPDSKQLLAVTSLTDKLKETRVNIYSIAFPPAELVTTPAEQHDGLPGWASFLIVVVLAGGAGYLLLVQLRKRKQEYTTRATSQSPVAAPVIIAPAPAAPVLSAIPVAEDILSTDDAEGIATDKVAGIQSTVFLFGNFEVRDKEGQDITRLFTPLLKELFLLISIYTIKYGQGISSEKLNEILWHDKSDKDAKNNRSVNMVKLKAVLEKVCDCVIRKEAGKWLIEYNTAEATIDLAVFLQLLENRQAMTKDTILRLLHIIKRGALLNQTDYSWLDDIKSDISNKVIDTLVYASTVLAFPADAELMIELANSIFYFDQVNEQALKLKCRSLMSLGRHSLAKNAYEKFAKEYRHMYGEDFNESFHDISNGI